MAANVDFYYFHISPPSRCAWMVLEELGIKYNEHVVDLIKGEHKTEAYKKINSRQKVPAIKDGDFSIGESRAIAAYLVSEYGAKQGKQSLYPSNPRQRAVVDQHLYISENVFDQIISYVSPGGVLFRGLPTQTDKIQSVRDALKMVESFLTDHKYTASDDLTIADFFYYAAVGMLDLTYFDEFDPYPKIAAWRKKISELPYHKKTWGDPAEKFRARYRSKLEENSKAK